jgi:hypothetical protein
MKAGVGPRTGSRPCSRPLSRAAGGLLGCAAALAPLQALAQQLGSPWWENYELKQSFLCPGHGSLVLERNESQASILSQGNRSTLFREPGEGADITYRNGEFRVMLKGDELTLQQGPRQITCMRTEEA